MKIILKTAVSALLFCGILTQAQIQKTLYESIEPHRFFGKHEHNCVFKNGIFYSMLKIGDEVRKNQILGILQTNSETEKNILFHSQTVSFCIKLEHHQ